MRSPLLTLALIALVSGTAALPARASTLFAVTNLVTDDQSAHAAQIEDPDLVNPWGVSYSPTSPFWVSDNGTGTSTIYTVAPATNATSKAGLTVTIPGAGSVTGQAFNGTAGQFNSDLFLFASEDGTISGWRAALGTSAEVLQLGAAENVYKGAALGTAGANSYLYSANFRAATIDVLKGSVGAPDLTGNFTDPNLPSGYAPFNVANLGGTLYVSYAVQDVDKRDEVAGAGNGIVDRYDLQGNLLERLATGGLLNAPWGMAIAPSSFGSFAGDLLVGNFGDGTITAYDLGGVNAPEQLKDGNGDPLVIDGLWALVPGNDGNAGSSGSIYFTAGPDGESHGLFGVISALPEPTTDLLVGLALTPLALARRRQAS
jgi:uncharacterized protein (TIGR03118 family)